MGRATQERSGDIDPHRPRVILLDDEAHLVESLGHRLRHNDWDLLTTTDPRALSDALCDGRGGVVVTDWQMPSLNGLDLVRRIRANEEAEAPCARTHIILMTGALSDEIMVTALDAGADEFMAKPFKHQELVARIGVGLRVVSFERNLQLANERLDRLARTDELTDLANRRAGMLVLEGELERVERGLQALAVILVDVDHFKHVNDRHGHEAGDAVLREIATRLANGVRGYDTVARWGGEEFLIVVPGATTTIAEDVAQRTLAAISAAPIRCGAEELQVTASLGLSVVERGCMAPPSVLLAAADEALYRAKANGRNQVCTGGVRLVHNAERAMDQINHRPDVLGLSECVDEIDPPSVIV